MPFLDNIAPFAIILSLVTVLLVGFGTVHYNEVKAHGKRND